jgi:hypothetical protein
MRRLVALVALPLLVLGCDSQENALGPGAQGGETQILIGRVGSVSASVAAAMSAVSSPPVEFSDVESLELVIDRVEAHRVGGGAWTAIELEPVTIDLAAIGEGMTAEVAAGELPAGTYNQLRFFLASSTVTFLNDITVGNETFVAGKIYDLDIPSVENSGLKINTAHFTVEETADESAETVLVLFDPAATTASIGVTGSGRVRMSPVLREADQATETEVEDSASDGDSGESGS